MKDNIAEQTLRIRLQNTNTSYQVRHVVLCVWTDPIVKGAISHRSGAFEDYTEARLFAKKLADEYSASIKGAGHTGAMYGSHATVYLDGDVFWSE